MQEEESKADPLGFLAMSLNESNVYVKLKSDSSRKELKGKLVGFDEHLTLMMTDCDETITSKVKDPVSGQDIERIKKI